MTLDEKFMSIALKEANKALLEDEVPVGCVIVDGDNKILSKAHNQREKKSSVFSHAECEAINKAARKRNDWQLVDCTIYVTLEPCIMCAGSILQSRFKRVVFGANDFKGGAFGSSINVLDSKNLNVNPEVTENILADQCSSLLSSYFKGKRLDNSIEKLSLEEKWKLFPIGLVEHNNNWVNYYKQERELLSHLLYSFKPLKIHHVGSTYFEDIQAKNIVDILIEFKNLNDMHKACHLLSKCGYRVMFEENKQAALNKGYGSNGFEEKVFHIHLREKGDIDEVIFRDYLVSHSKERKEYESLKIALAKENVNNRNRYTEMKTDFIQNVLNIAKNQKK